MEKNKIVSLLLVLVLVISLSVPVFASGSGSGDTRYAVVPFDTVAYSDGAFISEAGGNVNKVGSYGFFESPGISQTATIQTSIPGNNMIWDIDCTDYPSGIILSSRNVLVDWRTLDRLIITAGADTSGGIYVNYRIGIGSYREGSSDYYYSVDYVTGSVSGGSFNFKSVVQTLHANTPGFNPSGYVFFESIELECVGLAVSSDGSYSVQQSTNLELPTLDEWADNLPIYRTDTGSAPDFTGWLMGSLQSFFDFELIAGVSIGSLLEFIVVLGLVFWFLTMLI